MLFQCHPNEIKNTKPISHDLLEEILLQLAIKNQERIESCEYAEYIWSSDVVEFVFNISENMSLKRNVKYVALEIYERFIAEHIVDVRRTHSDLLKTRKDSRWEMVEERIKEQSVLRIMTSIQLASKLESHYDHVLPPQVSQILEKVGKPYSLNGIFSSELRILKTLNYKVNLTTPALYVELLLYVLYTNDPNIEEPLYDLTVTILDYVYLHRAQLYNELYNALGEDGNDMERDFNQNFMKVKADYMLLATSIIAATAYLFMNKCYELILEQLHQITRKVKADMKTFSVVIAYVVMNDMVE